MRNVSCAWWNGHLLRVFVPNALLLRPRIIINNVKRNVSECWRFRRKWNSTMRSLLRPRNNSKIYYFYVMRALHILMRTGMKIVERRWWYMNILWRSIVQMFVEMNFWNFSSSSSSFLSEISFGIKVHFRNLRNFLHLFPFNHFRDSYDWWRIWIEA